MCRCCSSEHDAHGEDATVASMLTSCVRVEVANDVVVPLPSSACHDGHDGTKRRRVSKTKRRRVKPILIPSHRGPWVVTACLAGFLCGAASPPAAFGFSPPMMHNVKQPKNSAIASVDTCRHLFSQDGESEREVGGGGGGDLSNENNGMAADREQEQDDVSNESLRTGLDALISAQVDEDISREAIGDKDNGSGGRGSSSNGVASMATSNQSDNGNKSTILWDVYVCQSKPCKERGAGATLDAFVGLAPSDYVQVHAAIIGKTRGRGPIVRCLRRTPVEESEETAEPRDNGDDDTAPNESSLDAFEVSNVDSVDKVYRILTKHMHLDGKVDSTACECLRWNYQGNSHLERNEVTQAIACYDKAIGTGYADQEGVVLLMRSTAYLKRSFQHQAELRKVVEELEVMVPRPENLQALFVTAKENPILARALHEKVVQDSRLQEKKFRALKFRHSLYEFALLHAAQDSLRATQLLPHYSKAWVRAGDALAELRKLREAARYYERAMEIDDGLVESLMPVVERLRASQQFLDEARAMGWPEDTLRLALDVSG